MSDNLLLRLLKAGLLEALGEDDQRRERAEAAAVATGEWLERDGRPHLLSAVVLAIDESSEPAGPAFDHAEELLLDEWPTLRYAYPEGPGELLRAIVLQGVNNAVAADPDHAAAAWYITRTLRDLSISAGRWSHVVDDMIGHIDRAVRERLARKWAPTSAASKLVIPEAADDADLPEVVSTGQLYASLEPYKSDFVSYYQHVSGALAEHVPPILDELVAAAGLRADLRAWLAQQASLVEASRLREALLWWRLGGRSELLGMRYRQVEDPAELALVAAGDLYLLCPAVTPEAVEHLLADVVSDSAPLDVQLSFGQLAEAWKVLLPSLGLGHSAEPLGALVLGHRGALPPAMVRDLTPVEAAVIAFRDLQAMRLTSVVSDSESSS